MDYAQKFAEALSFLEEFAPLLEANGGEIVNTILNLPENKVRGNVSFEAI